MKYRMYFFVPYNISPIQQAIQAGHAALEYAWKFFEKNDYKAFMQDKTWIILNGGTTNKNWTTEFGISPQRVGTLNAIADNIEDAGINYAIFEEPDLNDALTAVCFLADERVWDWENYPNFRDYLNNTALDIAEYPFLKHKRIKSKSDFSDSDLLISFPKEYYNWLEKIGGEKNAFLKNLIEGKKLA